MVGLLQPVPNNFHGATASLMLILTICTSLPTVPRMCCLCFACRQQKCAVPYKYLQPYFTVTLYQPIASCDTEEIVVTVQEGQQVCISPLVPQYAKFKVLWQKNYPIQKWGVLSHVSPLPEWETDIAQNQMLYNMYPSFHIPFPDLVKEHNSVLGLLQFTATHLNLKTYWLCLLSGIIPQDLLPFRVLPLTPMELTSPYRLDDDTLHENSTCCDYQIPSNTYWSVTPTQGYHCVVRNCTTTSCTILGISRCKWTQHWWTHSVYNGPIDCTRWYPKWNQTCETKQHDLHWPRRCELAGQPCWEKNITEGLHWFNETKLGWKSATGFVTGFTPFFLSNTSWAFSVSKCIESSQLGVYRCGDSHVWNRWPWRGYYEEPPSSRYTYETYQGYAPNGKEA
ncbi:uncharacterized protein LOC133378076 [Rhineura floridana]|uniref:uncharacterized protein LOC133378076 n=1 Tax=Rhineura floridana TaxID=261503 RepID=UPI002AC87C15|nr:uncharacterized protein LOC133378076 [Rhineura floridana]XP_061468848.1 uncharacterized protein LOC133378076 [Rhineura floridana]XP_061468849.1 uncharacterized protein LOC133378076 [Rhineura floridana]